MGIVWSSSIAFVREMFLFLQKLLGIFAAWSQMKSLHHKSSTNRNLSEKYV